jgi:hypothetical protein
MTILNERELHIHFTNAEDGFVFDQMDPKQPNFHGISDMHRVDFIVELASFWLFVEVKDPGNPKAQAEGLEKFHDELKDGTLSDTFASKFLDSFIYHWAESKVEKPIHYISLVTLEAALLLNLSDEIARKLPPKGKPVQRWKRPVYENCQVFNIETWNENFPKWPATRISAAAQAAPFTQGIQK